MELGPATIFSVLNLKSGYWQVPLEEASRQYMACTTPDGASFEFLVIPFDLAGAPGIFQKLLRVLEGYILNNFVKVYLDDIIVYSKILEQHREHLGLVLERLQIHGLR